MGLSLSIFPCVRRPEGAQHRSGLLWVDVPGTPTPTKESTSTHSADLEKLTHAKDETPSSTSTMTASSVSNDSSDQTSANTTPSTTEESATSISIIYLNHAGQAPLSPMVHTALHKILYCPTADWSIVADQAQATIRILFAQLLSSSSSRQPKQQKHSKQQQNQPHAPSQNVSGGCTHCDIALMPSTAFAMTLAAHNILQHPHWTPHTLARTTTSSSSLSSSSSRHHPQKRFGAKYSQYTYKILVLQDQYPSAIYPWQELIHQHNTANQQQRHNNNNSKIRWSLHAVPYPQDTRHDSSTLSWTDLILEHLQHLGSIVRVVALPPVHWATGQLIDLERIATFCQQQLTHPPHLVIDATQAVGILPLPNSLTRYASVIACSVHKWLRSPTNGLSCVYIHPTLHHLWQPLDQHERGRYFYCEQQSQQALATRHFMDPTTGCYPSAFATNARKFDAGGKPNPFLWTMVAAAMKEVVGRVQPPQAQKHLERLLRPVREWCRAHGFRLEGSRGQKEHQYYDVAHHILHIGLPRGVLLTKSKNNRGRHDEEDEDEKEAAYLVHVVNRLAKEYGIVVAARCGGLRISPYLDTTPADIQHLQKALYQVIILPYQQKLQQRQQPKEKQKQSNGSNNKSKTPQK